METIQTTKTESKNSKNIDLVTLQIKRTVQGTRLYIQSQVFDDFFSQMGETGETFRDADNKIQELNGIPELSEDNTFYRLRQDRMHTLRTNEGYVNLAFLRTVGIKNGVLFKIDKLQSKQAIKQFTAEFKDASIELYTQYIKPETRHMSIKITEGKD